MKTDINWQEENDETLVCYCSKVNKKTVVDALKNGASDIKSIQKATNAGIGGRCKELNPNGRCCHPDIAAILKLYNYILNPTKPTNDF